VKGNRGFTLLEMIVATLIMAIAITALLSGLSGATRNAARLREYERAAQLARYRMNELIMDRRFPVGSTMSGIFDERQTGGAEINWRARIEPFEMPPKGVPARVGIDRIELEISWRSGIGIRTFTLDSYRPRVLGPGE
jgi:general secretion pathway protein I